MAESVPKRIAGITERSQASKAADNDSIGARRVDRGETHAVMIALKFEWPPADDGSVIDAIHIPDPMRLTRPAATSDERQQPQRRRQRQRPDGVPAAKVYAPDGHVEEQQEQDLPRIDLVG